MIALVIPGPLDRRSGGYSYDVDLTAFLREAGHRVEVWSLPEGHGCRAALREYLAASHPDVVIFDALVHPPLVRFLETWKPARGRWVALVHHLAWLEEPGCQGIRRKQRRERRFLETMDAFIFNSANTRDTVAVLREPGPFKPSVICPPPVSPGVRGSGPADAGRLLFAGNVQPRKNLAGFLEALVLLHRRRPDLDWTLTVVGSLDVDPGYVHRCRKIAGGGGIGGRIVWKGRVDDAELEGLRWQTDLFVQPSFHEGWGMAAAEALVRGIVTLAVPRGGLPEVLGNAALWTEPDAEAMAARLEAFLDRPELRADLARKARLRGKALAQGSEGFSRLPSFLDQLLSKTDEPPSFRFTEYLEAKAAVDSRSLHPRILGTALAEPPDHVVELGGGTGTMARRLRTQGRLGSGTRYELVDFDPDVLAGAAACADLFDPGRFLAVRSDLLAFCEDYAGPPPDLVVAHAVLDLFDPGTAAAALARLKGRRYWLTHLFDGLTAWEPEIDPALDRSIVDAYHRSMEERSPGRGQGSFRSGRDWLSVLPRAGFRILDAGASDWIVRPDRGAYPDGEAAFLRSILHFFRTSLTGRADVDPEGLAWWLEARRRQVDRGEALFLAHQIDVAAELETGR